MEDTRRMLTMNMKKRGERSELKNVKVKNKNKKGEGIKLKEWTIKLSEFDITDL